MRSRFALTLLLPVALALPGTAVSQIAAQGSQEQRIELLERRVGALSDIMLRLDRLQSEIQQLRGEVELQSHELESLKKRQRDLYLDVDQRLGQVAGGAPSGAPFPAGAGAAGGAPDTAPTPTAAPPPAAPPATPAPGTGDPAREAARYQAAFDLLMQRRYEEARSAFDQFLSDYPGGQYADNAQYWLAEASYVIRDFARAEPDFSRVITQYPESAKVPDALLKIGFIQYEQQQWQAARETLNRLVREYPVSTAARLAEKRLERMATEGR